MTMTMIPAISFGSIAGIERHETFHDNGVGTLVFRWRCA